MTEESTSSVEAAVPLPTPVRDRAVGLAADTLGALAATEIPTRLRAVARFAPARRAKLGSGPLAGTDMLTASCRRTRIPQFKPS